MGFYAKFLQTPIKLATQNYMYITLLVNKLGFQI